MNFFRRRVSQAASFDPRAARVKAIEPLESRRLLSATLYVDPTGDDANLGDSPTAAWRTIQKAFDAASAGSTVHVAPGVYREKLQLNVSGNEADGAIRFVADGQPGEVVVSGKRVKGQNLIHIVDRDYITIEGFTLRDNAGVRDGSGVRIEGASGHIVLRDNRIENIRGKNAMGITVYGTDPAAGVHDLTIDGNEISKCQAAPSEALTLNGNVHDFSVTNNYVHDVNNIGIVFIGGEGISSDPATDQARNGVCAGNRVERARSSYGGGFAAGIYVDGGRDIVVERNVVTESDLGIEVGCEHAGLVARNVTVRNNLIAFNVKAGLAFGGYAMQVGRTEDCVFVNNTIYHNRKKSRGAGGEIWVQLGSGNLVANNLIVGGNRNDLLLNDENTTSPATESAPANVFHHNFYFADDARANPQLIVDGQSYATFADYVTATGHDSTSTYADPLLAAPDDANFSPGAGSPLIDAGDANAGILAGPFDLLGNPRVVGMLVDIGAMEAVGPGQ